MGDAFELGCGIHKSKSFAHRVGSYRGVAASSLAQNDITVTPFVSPELAMFLPQSSTSSCFIVA